MNKLRIGPGAFLVLMLGFGGLASAQEQGDRVYLLGPTTLRAGPSESAEVTREITRPNSFLFQRCEGRWCLVEGFRGAQHWLRSNEFSLSRETARSVWAAHEANRRQKDEDRATDSDAELSEPLASDTSRVVNGFHGYEWATPRNEIPEVRGASRSSQSILARAPTYIREVNLLGYPGIALFVFDTSGDGGLIMGGYIFELTLANCEDAVDEIEEVVQNAYPQLRPVREAPSQAEVNSGVYDSLCEYFVFNADSETWRTRFANSSGNVEVLLSMNQINLEPTLNVIYYSQRAAELIDAGRQSDEARFGPVN